VTKPPFVITHKAVITRVGMLHFTSQYKDTVQRRLIILMSFCSKFIRDKYTNNYSNIATFDKNYCKNIMVQFFASRCMWFYNYDVYILDAYAYLKQWTDNPQTNPQVSKQVSRQFCIQRQNHE